MPIEQVETPKTNEEIAQENKPLLNIQLPAPDNGNPNAPLSVGRHNASAQHNFQKVADVLLTVINNQKMMGMLINSLSDKQQELDKSVTAVADSIKVLLDKKENENDKSKPTSATTK